MSDEDYMRLAFAVARRAAEKGNPPFGAVLVDRAGEVVLEAENTVASESDCTGHAESNLIRAASRRYGPGALGEYAMYTSCEPCAMCTAAAFWGGLGRIVFGLSSGGLRKIRGAEAPTLDLPSREVISRGTRAVEITGPLLEDEGAALFAGR